MSTFAILMKACEFNRTRTLGLLDKIDALPRPGEALFFRPGPGRAPMGWQLMHVGITEEIFATERLAPEKSHAFAELWPRFRGGSVPDDQPLDSRELRNVLEQSRKHLFDTLNRFTDANLGDIPAALRDRGLTMLDVLHILSWHEAHHQGQAHITFNLYQAQR